MEKKESGGVVSVISRLLDDAAGWGIVVTMALVVVNILLRVIFKNSIQGIYEYVGYITAAVIGLALAWCALEKAHISIDFIVEKMPAGVRKIVDVITGSVAVIFLLFSCLQTCVYGVKVMNSGEVSATSQIPFYPFIFIVAAGFFVLSLSEFTKILKGVKTK